MLLEQFVYDDMDEDDNVLMGGFDSFDLVDFVELMLIMID